MSAGRPTQVELAWVSGEFRPRADVAVPLGDAGFVLGSSVTEQLRTFHGDLFLADEHFARLAGSLAVVGLVPTPGLAAIRGAAVRVARENRSRLAAARGGEPGPDLGVVIVVTPGDQPAQHEGAAAVPRTFVHSFPLAFNVWAAAYDRGVSLRTVPVRQVPDECWPVAAKVRSRLHYFLADRAAEAAEPGARAVLEHLDGRISETSTANVAVVRGGRVLTPPAADVLSGVSLACARRLAAGLGIGWEERSLVAADLATADEILLTSTPSCILPATRFDGRPVGDGVPGDVFHRLLAAWNGLVGLDIAAQARTQAGRRPRIVGRD